MDRVESAPPLALAASDIPAPPPRRRYITLRLLPPAPAPGAKPVCRSAYFRSDGLSGPDRDRLQPETPPTIWSSRLVRIDSTDLLRPLIIHLPTVGAKPLLRTAFSALASASTQLPA